MEGMIAIWQRDVLKFFKDRARLFGSMTMPVLLLIVFGVGMGGSMESLMSSAVGGDLEFNYVEFIFPGIVSMTLLMTSVFSSLSIIQDRDFGYMREILVSPVSRVNIAIGKMLDSATVAFMQGLMLFILMPVLGVSIDLVSFFLVLPVMFLLACTFASLGLLVASILKSTQAFQLVVNALVMPMIFLSGALFPLNNMPAWVDFLVTLNPVTYGVDLMKHIMIDVENLSAEVYEEMGLNLDFFGIPVTPAGEILFIVGFTTILIILATFSFSRSNS
ncbi:ABC transporter, permease protein [Geomicrobium sp. JCM 19037]|uniref:ABC transporter permease n=1 Tax=Geomicrobium sp. JCM 19037 TaxID=1460634 RepID=UPI00045F10C0|nr:ABC transporter permease [Geomicrobium sp. JCM 19037]GAK05799.1 ABC transporter, permease protein [Geomicrobium sp. JCM 19037]